MRAKLTRKERQALKLASTEGVQGHAKWIKRYLSRGMWLGQGNSFRKDPIGRIERCGEIVKDRDKKHLGEYIAASAPLHLFDGWNYLGQAFHAHIRGCNALAIHLGYYAELRAAISLLATQGIGVFSNRHFTVEDPKNIHSMSEPENRGKGTHKATWRYFEWWTRQSKSTDLFGQMIRFRSRTLIEWIESMPRNELWIPVARDFLLNIGLDLKHMDKDHVARNFASYRPSFGQNADLLSFREKLLFLSESVRAMEKTGSGFDLDRYIVRVGVEQGFYGIYSALPVDSPSTYRTQIDAMMEAMTDSEESKQRLTNFFLRNPSIEEEPMFIREATKIGQLDDPNRHLQVLSRALLLLRVATGSTSNFLEDAGIHFDEMEFWWKKKGIEIGLWNDDIQAVNVGDNWANVVQALDEIDEWLRLGGESLEADDLQLAHSLNEVTNLGRVGIIGLWNV